MGSSRNACALLLVVVMANLDNISGSTSGGGGYGGVNPDGTTYGGSYKIDDNGAHITSRHGAPAPGAHQPDFSFPTQFPFVPQSFFGDYFRNFDGYLKQNTEDMVRRSQEQAETIHRQVQENINRAFQNNEANHRRAFEASQNAFHDAQNNYYPGAGGYGAGAGGYGGAWGYGSGAGGYGTGGAHTYGSSSGGSGSSGPTLGSRGAFASGAIGPQGTRQTASVFPNNPRVPNVDVSSGPSNPNGGGGFYSVSSSSFSKSSDIGGKKSHEQGAKTTVNDNGKVTTHEVHNP